MLLSLLAYSGWIAAYIIFLVLGRTGRSLVVALRELEQAKRFANVQFQDGRFAEHRVSCSSCQFCKCGKHLCDRGRELLGFAAIGEKLPAGERINEGGKPGIVH